MDGDLISWLCCHGDACDFHDLWIRPNSCHFKSEAIIKAASKHNDLVVVQLLIGVGIRLVKQGAGAEVEADMPAAAAVVRVATEGEVYNS